MSDLDALLQACKDEPFDDAPRQILADWLEERGDPDRAEFIRLQLRRVTLSDLTPDGLVLATRERELTARHAARWLGPLARWGPECRFERGLVRVEATA